MGIIDPSKTSVRFTQINHFLMKIWFLGTKYFLDHIWHETLKHGKAEFHTVTPFTFCNWVRKISQNTNGIIYPSIEGTFLHWRILSFAWMGTINGQNLLDLKQIGYYTPNFGMYMFHNDKSFPIGICTSYTPKLLGMIQPTLESISEI